MNIRVIQTDSYGYDIFVNNSPWGEAEVGVELVAIYKESQKGNKIYLKRIKAISPSGNLIERIKKAVEDELLYEVIESLDQ